MTQKVKDSVDFLTKKGFRSPVYGIVLGTGLDALADEIDIESEIAYADIPHFPVSTVEFHQGRLIVGALEGKRVIAMQGRFHYYEGYSMEEVVFPIRVMHALGIKKLLISNASGCMNKSWNKGELMLIDDHINLQPDSPLRGKNATAFGAIFTDMSTPYNREMNKALKKIAEEKKITLHEGVYASVPGPNLETRAEYRYLIRIGAHAVGMSTVPEVIAANQLQLPVSAVSVLTDECDPDRLNPVDVEDIIATAKKAEKDLVALFKRFIGEDNEFSLI